MTGMLLDWICVVNKQKLSPKSRSLRNMEDPNGERQEDANMEVVRMGIVFFEDLVVKVDE